MNLGINTDNHKRYIISLCIVALLIAFRLYLPTLVKKYVNKVLADIPGYYGQVEDIDIALTRGAFVINGMHLNRVTSKSQVPFLNFPKNDISIEWKSLFNGKIVSEIVMTNPEVVYVFEDQQTNPEEDEPNAEDWTKALTDLVPIDINHIEVHDGKVAFLQLSAEPNIDLHIAKIHLTADNLRNVVEKERILPSPIRATGVSIGNGKVALEGNMNLIKEIPDIELSFSIEGAEATALNNFTNYYASLDFNKGTVNVYSEFAIAEGHFVGYVKPLFTDTKLIGKEDGVLEDLWEGFIGLFKFLLKNQGTDNLSTKVPMEGDLNNVETGVWSTIFNIFENAWVRAFTGEVDGAIEFKDAVKNESPTLEQKRELKKIERERRREESKKQRQIKKG